MFGPESAQHISGLQFAHEPIGHQPYGIDSYPKGSGNEFFNLH